jgi:hypothetical protein
MYVMPPFTETDRSRLEGWFVRFEMSMSSKSLLREFLGQPLQVKASYIHGHIVK